MGTVWQDLRYGLRMLLRHPGFTAVAVLTLALGIGATTAIFSVINVVLLRPLAFEVPERLFIIWETVPRKGILDNPVSYPNFRDWKERNRVFEEIAVFRSTESTLTGIDEPERIKGACVSAGFFLLLGVRPMLGRTFRPEEDQPGAENVVVLSHGFWQRRFGGDAGVLGKTVTLDGANFTVIGVLPPGFQFPLGISKAEVWTPTARDAGFFPQRGALILHALARLKPGINREQAQAEMNAIARQLEAEHPDYMAGRGVNLVPLHQQVVGEVRPALLMLWGAVGLVLLVACANVANLLLVRGAAREKEVAIRLALGAGRWRLVRQLLTESVLLAVIGGGLGLLLALWTTDALVAITPRDIPRMEQIGLDRRVLGFALGLSVLTGLVFGLAPALSTSRIPLTESLKEGSRTVGVWGRLRLRRLLAVTETALAVVLLIGGGLLVRSFVNLLRVDPGFRPENVLTFQMAVPFEQSDADRRANFYSDILARLQALPGVQSVGGATSIPVSGVNHMEIGFEILGRPLRPGEDPQSAAYDSVTPDHFHTMGIPLRQGRLFTEQDQRGRPGAVIINDALAGRYWRGENPLGQRIRVAISFGEPGEPESYEIVGIVGDVHERGPDTEAKPHLYVPYRQQTWPFFTFALRTSGDPRPLIGAIRASVAELTKKEAVYDFKTMEEYLAASVARRRFAMVLMGIFAGLTLVLAAIGIYGFISHSTSQRTHEIGVRMTLGAQRQDVLKLVLGQGMILVVIGVGIGLVAALMLTRLLSSLLFGVTPTDPVTFASVSLLLVAVALLACYIPARRATKVDPMVALRYE